jgi:hypothetical protein
VDFPDVLVLPHHLWPNMVFHVRKSSPWAAASCCYASEAWLTLSLTHARVSGIAAQRRRCDVPQTGRGAVAPPSREPEWPGGYMAVQP